MKCRDGPRGRPVSSPHAYYFRPKQHEGLLIPCLLFQTKTKGRPSLHFLNDLAIYKYFPGTQLQSNLIRTYGSRWNWLISTVHILCYIRLWTWQDLNTMI